MNYSENLFKKLAKERKWEIKHRGLPDFICWKNGDIMFVEIKDKKDRLSKHQQLVMFFLEKHKIPCFVWRPGDKFPGKKFSSIRKTYFTSEENYLNNLRGF